MWRHLTLLSPGGPPVGSALWASILIRQRLAVLEGLANNLSLLPRAHRAPVRNEWPMLPGRVIPFLVPVDPPSAGAEQPNIVVQIGRDEELLRLRAKVISSAGYTVHSMTPDQATGELKKAQGARVWVFCHTLEFYELALLAVAIRRERPADKLLRLTGLNDIRQVPGLFDELLEPVKGVDDLLRMVADLARH
jgi:hypothetical protein